MASVLEWLFGGRDARKAAGDTDTVRRIVGELDKLPPDRARYLGAFAYVLSRIAGADLQIGADETTTMVSLLTDVGQLPEAQALLVVEIAKAQNRLAGGTEDFLVTREFRQIASDEERQTLLGGLFAVAAADGEISSEEDAQVWQTAAELGFSRSEFVTARLAYSDRRAVLKKKGV